MRFALGVHGSPYSSQASATALRFAIAALAKGMEIRRVFFFHDGSLTGNAIAFAPQDSAPSRDAWAELAVRYDFELAICIATALKRGVVDEDERARYGLPGPSLHPAFTLVGLGQLIDAMSDCDRLVTFSP